MRGPCNIGGCIRSALALFSSLLHPLLSLSQINIMLFTTVLSVLALSFGLAQAAPTCGENQEILYGSECHDLCQEGTYREPGSRRCVSSHTHSRCFAISHMILCRSHNAQAIPSCCLATNGGRIILLTFILLIPFLLSVSSDAPIPTLVCPDQKHVNALVLM